VFCASISITASSGIILSIFWITRVAVAEFIPSVILPYNVPFSVNTAVVPDVQLIPSKLYSGVTPNIVPDNVTVTSSFVHSVLSGVKINSTSDCVTSISILFPATSYNVPEYLVFNNNPLSISGPCIVYLYVNALAVADSNVAVPSVPLSSNIIPNTGAFTSNIGPLFSSPYTSSVNVATNVTSTSSL